MKTSSCKAKGARLSKRIKELLLAQFPLLSDGDIVVTPAGVTGPDLHLSPAARAYFNYDIECKMQEALNVWSSMEQASQHGPNPVLFFSRNRSKTFAVIEADKFINLVARAHGNSGNE